MALAPVMVCRIIGMPDWGGAVRNFPRGMHSGKARQTACRADKEPPSPPWHAGHHLHVKGGNQAPGHARSGWESRSFMILHVAAKSLLSFARVSAGDLWTSTPRCCDGQSSCCDEPIPRSLAASAMLSLTFALESSHADCSRAIVEDGEARA